MQREILHLFLPSFSLQALVGERDRFTHHPAVIAGNGSASARVLSLNPTARSEGIHRGMALAEARRRCPKVEVHRPRHDVLLRASHAVADYLSRYSPHVEPGQGGFYVDLSGCGKLFGPPMDLSVELIRQCGDRFGLVSSAGIGTCKLVGRAASSLVEAPGTAQVMPSREASFLRPFPIRHFLGRERRLMARLAELGIERVGDIENFSLSELVGAFGADGRRLHDLARGVDFSPVVTPHAAPEFEEGESFAEATNDLQVMRAALLRLSENLGRRLRERKARMGLMRLMVQYKDGSRVERRARMNGTAYDCEIRARAMRLLESAIGRRVQVIFLGLRASELTGSHQPDLFGEDDRRDRLYRAIDDLRGKYGRDVVHIAMP